jgi:hypothetical protein
MSGNESVDIQQRVRAALDFAAPPGGGAAMRAQNTWLIREMMRTVKLEHLSDQEIAVMVSALAAAHGRLLLLEGGTVADPVIAPVLTLIPRDAGAEFLDEAADL